MLIAEIDTVKNSIQSWDSVVHGSNEKTGITLTLTLNCMLNTETCNEIKTGCLTGESEISTVFLTVLLDSSDT